jgi:hypothetical protein
MTFSFVHEIEEHADWISTSFISSFRHLALVITGAQASMYSMKPQITIGYQAHIQVDPICKNIEVFLPSKTMATVIHILGVSNSNNFVALE